MKNWYVYILECSDNSLYTGISTNISERVEKHNSKKGAKYVLGRLPVKLVYSEKVKDISWALKREKEIKKFKKEQKLALIKNQTGR